jgi:hypothetical protein
MLVREARAAAKEWVSASAARMSGFRGAFFSGSTAALSPDSILSSESDVDVVVVVASSNGPPKLGKFRYEDALLDVSYLPWNQLAHLDQVARSYQLAPSFSSNQVIADPTGHLDRLYRAISASFADPEAVRRRCESALTKLEAGLAAIDSTAVWHDQVTAWMFPTSITTHVVLVAALRNPTVRLRYLAAREVLYENDKRALYETLLELLGCEDCDRPSVQRHLDELSEVFDQAVAVAKTPFFFSGDITPHGRPVAIDGSQQLIDNGDHREAVFWLIATYARCQKILSADAPSSLRHAGSLRFCWAVRELLGVHDVADLFHRRDAVSRLLPVLSDAAASITNRSRS